MVRPKSSHCRYSARDNRFSTPPQQNYWDFGGRVGVVTFLWKKAVESENRTQKLAEIKNRTQNLRVFSFACYQLSHNSRGRESRVWISGGGSGGRGVGISGGGRESIVSTTCMGSCAVQTLRQHKSSGLPRCLESSDIGCVRRSWTWYRLVGSLVSD